MRMKAALIVFTMCLTGCASGRSQIDELMSRVYLGMPLAEFNRVVPKKRVVEMRNDVTIYKVTRRNWYDSDGSGADFRYFYFVDGKLESINQGERAVDYRIRVN